MTSLYHVEIYKVGQYEETKQSFVTESGDRYAAMKVARASGNFNHLNGNAAKKVSGKAAVALIADGSTDLRAPKVATTENRKALGRLVGM